MSFSSLLRPLIPVFFRNAYRAYSLLRNFRPENYKFLRFAPPGHFYSPIPDIKEIELNSEALFDRSAKEIPGVDINEKIQLSLANKFIAFYGEIPFPHKQQADTRYYFDNSYFSYGDGVSLYSLMRIIRPKRVVEVGSGFSSAEMLDVNDKYFDSEIQFIFIEPYPNRLFALLRHKDMNWCSILEKPVQEVPMEVFHNMRENDILFIDSSHVGKTHSDVLHILFKILPSLEAGVVIHFHDILWPFEYPRLWFDHGRAWNEAYFLRAFLQYNKSFEILYFNSFMEIHHGGFLGKNMPLIMMTPSSEIMPGNSSLWLKKTL